MLPPILRRSIPYLGFVVVPPRGSSSTNIIGGTSAAATMARSRSLGARGCRRDPSAIVGNDDGDEKAPSPLPTTPSFRAGIVGAGSVACGSASLQSNNTGDIDENRLDDRNGNRGNGAIDERPPN